jgi:hypothetical protein
MKMVKRRSIILIPAQAETIINRQWKIVTCLPAFGGQANVGSDQNPHSTGLPETLVVSRPMFSKDGEISKSRSIITIKVSYNELTGQLSLI